MKKSNKTLLASATLGLSLPLLIISCSSVSPVPRPTVTTTTQTTYRTGSLVGSLPTGYRSESISGRDYYYNKGSYFQKRGSGYIVVDAPRSSRYYDEYTRVGGRTYHNHSDGSSHVINELPKGYTTIKRGGQPYYRYQNQYYQRQGNRYITVAEPH